MIGSFLRNDVTRGGLADSPIKSLSAKNLTVRHRVAELALIWTICSLRDRQVALPQPHGYFGRDHGDAGILRNWREGSRRLWRVMPPGPLFRLKSRSANKVL